MTSQIVLLNGFGVAIASDSAMTMGENGRTYDTAEKVVALGMPHRMAVLHAGRVRLGNLPYSILVGEWIRQLGDKPLRNSEAYQQNFLDWVNNNQQFFPPDLEHNDVIEFIKSRTENLIGRYNRIRTDRPDFELTTLLSAWTDEAKNEPRLEGMDAAAARRVFTKYRNEIDEILNGQGETAAITDELVEPFLDYCAEYYSSSWMTNATLTFAGYGERELYASFTQVNFHGLVAGRMTWVTENKYALSPSDNPLWAICMPAQRDAMDQYLRGYDHEMISEIIELADSERLHVLEHIREEFEDDPETLTRLDAAIEKTLEVFESSIWQVTREFSDNNYISGLQRAIAALPAASLVDVARSLIELQALRKTTTAQQNTVGGPIDVALITPSDGFQWVRHKSIN